jgi:hypothetical protein
MKAALRDARMILAIQREKDLLEAAAKDVWATVPTGIELPKPFIVAINRLGCAIRGEWHLLAPVASSAPEQGSGDSQVAAPPDIGLPGASESEIREWKHHHAHIRELSDDLANPAWIEGWDCPDCPKSVTAGATITGIDYPSGTVTANAAVLRANARTRRVGSHA